MAKYLSHEKRLECQYVLGKNALKNPKYFEQVLKWNKKEFGVVRKFNGKSKEIFRRRMIFGHWGGMEQESKGALCRHCPNIVFYQTVHS